MKKIFVLLITFALFSCSFNDDDQTEIFDEFLPIESVELPSEFKFGESQEISLTYIRPTDCHGFRNVLFEEKGNSKIVVVVATKFVTPGNECDIINSEHQATFNVVASIRKNYVFKFWKGKDEEGKDIFLEIEVPVIN